MAQNTLMIKEEVIVSNNLFDSVQQEEKTTDLLEFAQQHQFNMTIPHADAQPKKRFQLGRKFMAIACYTTIKKEYIMERIVDEFPSNLQYVCISSPNRLSVWHPELILIQIVVKKAVTKNSYFFKKIAGMQCNYKVTNDVLAWNRFLKKVGNYIEMGQFRPIRLRFHTRSNRKSQPIYKNENTKRTIQPVELQSSNNELLTKQLIADGLADIKACFERVIDWTSKYIPAECSGQRDAFLAHSRSSLDYLMQYDIEDASSPSS